MQCQVFLMSAVTFMVLCGHIHSSPLPTTAPESHHHTDYELKVDNSNPILGDIPIPQDNKVDIFNRKYVPLKNCKEILDYGDLNKSGLYTVQPGDGGEFVVYCDMTLLGGGWTVIQRRLNSGVSFNRTYASYKNGFGDFTENFWLGLEKINRLTANSDTPMEVYIGVHAFFDSSTFSHYSQFSVGNESSGYKLSIDGYNKSSSAGDSMTSQNNQKFSTRDRDQDTDRNPRCANRFQGFKAGWWFKDCVYSNLNGIYYEEGPNNHVPDADGISWRTWTGNTYSLKNTVIAIRPADS